jgi:hypothetical protein
MGVAMIRAGAGGDAQACKRAQWRATHTNAGTHTTRTHLQEGPDGGVKLQPSKVQRIHKGMHDLERGVTKRDEV